MLQRLSGYLISVIAAMSLSGALSAKAYAGTEGAALEVNDVEKLVGILQLIEREYVAPVGGKALVDSALAGAVKALDPHSQYLKKAAMDELESASSGTYAGIGIEAEEHNGRIRVVAAVEDSPAQEAGIKTGDVIVAVDGKQTSEMPLEQVTKRIRGAEGSQIELTISRGVIEQQHTYVMLRKTVTSASVKSKMISHDIAWIRITQFQEATADQLASDLARLYKGRPQIRGIVLDLRNDPGGLVGAAVSVAGMFLPANTIVLRTKGRADGVNSVISTDAEDPRSGHAVSTELLSAVRSVPMVVLINGASASASEIVAGALQDHGRAKVIGTRSFGKGSVQSLIRLPDETGLKLTIARYYTPNGHEIQAKGILPDEIVELKSGVQLSGLYEADLPNHLENEQLQGNTATSPKTDKHQEVFITPQSAGTDKDRQLAHAVKLLTKNEIATLRLKHFMQGLFQ